LPRSAPVTASSHSWSVTKRWGPANVQRAAAESSCSRKHAANFRDRFEHRLLRGGARGRPRRRLPCDGFVRSEEWLPGCPAALPPTAPSRGCEPPRTCEGRAIEIGYQRARPTPPEPLSTADPNSKRARVGSRRVDARPPFEAQQR
jgi:hypothetical protein